MYDNIIVNNYSEKIINSWNKEGVTQISIQKSKNTDNTLMEQKPIDDCCKSGKCSSLKSNDIDILKLKQETSLNINDIDVDTQIQSISQTGNSNSNTHSHTHNQTPNPSSFSNNINLSTLSNTLDINTISYEKKYNHIQMFHELRILT